MANSSEQSIGQRLRRPLHLSSLCVALLVSSPATSAFAPTKAVTKSKVSSLAPRSAVIQRYRVDDEQSSSDVSQPKPSGVYSFLPKRVSSIGRLDGQSQFQAQVLEEEDSLVVVRFYAEICPSCKATGPFFRKWSRELDDIQSNNALVDGIITTDNDMPIKILEMPLTRATSSFLKDELQIEKMPYCHLYHPKFGLVDERLVMNRGEFDEFVHTVNGWSKGSCELCLDGHDELDCQEFC